MFQHLYPHFQVHALDHYGMGLSSRGNWNDNMTPKEAVNYFVEAVEEWTRAVGLMRFILVGHSFGGFIASHYMRKYATKVQQLIFLSPAGMCVWPE
jgi:pimeloyl-ACP methyl ester carboxylesterase